MSTIPSADVNRCDRCSARLANATKAEMLTPLISLHRGDCADVMWSLPDRSYDACVTDAPYGLSGIDSNRGMGVGWDGAVPSAAVWSECLRVLKPGSHIAAFGYPRTSHRLATNIETAGFEIVDTLAWLTGNGSARPGRLKTAMTPIVLARRPHEGKLADNVRRHGVGSLNIDTCRTPTDEEHGIGRWPSQIAHVGSEEVISLFPQSGQKCRKNQRDGEASAKSRNAGAVGFNMRPGMRRSDVGSAARFFYCARASKAERGEGNDHKTVKPVTLLRWLCRLNCPFPHSDRISGHILTELRSDPAGVDTPLIR